MLGLFFQVGTRKRCSQSLDRNIGILDGTQEKSRIKSLGEGIYYSYANIYTYIYI